jgi:hypothetical protein
MISARGADLPSQTLLAAGAMAGPLYCPGAITAQAMRAPACPVGSVW